MALSTLHKNLIAQNVCPVCGYEMEDPAADYNTCPSCGTEFGLHDINAAIEELRASWIKTGPKWWSTTDPQPERWNPFFQLARLHSDAGTVLAARRVFIIETKATQQFNQAEEAMRTAVLGMAMSLQPSMQPLDKQLEAAS